MAIDCALKHIRDVNAFVSKVMVSISREISWLDPALKVAV